MDRDEMHMRELAQDMGWAVDGEVFDIETDRWGFPMRVSEGVEVGTTAAVGTRSGRIPPHPVDAFLEETGEIFDMKTIRPTGPQIDHDAVLFQYIFGDLRIVDHFNIIREPEVEDQIVTECEEPVNPRQRIPAHIHQQAGRIRGFQRGRR